MKHLFRSLLPAIAVTFFTLQLHAQQAQRIEKVVAKPGELAISYEKYVLPNGLTVVIHEDHSDPVVHVDVTYHVGSAREEIGKSGFAHFFEHMMFQGSDNVADEEHFKLVTEAGGTLNGSTNRDRTNYYETLPSNQLEIALWLEADRMGFLLDAVTQQKFEVQRATVKNERGQNYDNRPYGLAREYIGKNMYSYGHPYSWLTIGYVEDLNRVDVNDLKRFFLRWYGPNNATLTVGGDVEPEQVLKLAEKYFGSIPRGPEVNNMQAMPAKLDRDRYVSYVDNYIRFPQLNMVFSGVPSYHPDELALSALAEMIAGGKSSPMYQNFIKARKATQANMFSSGSELAGEISITIQPNPGQSLAEMEALVRQTLKEFEEKGPGEEALARFKTNYEVQRLNFLSSVRGKVSFLAAFQTFTGNPGYLSEISRQLEALSTADVMRVYNQYIKGKPSVILSVLPKSGNVAPAAPDNYAVDESGYVAPPDQYANLKYVKAKDNFDRSQKPGQGPNPVITPPPYWTAELSNGLKLIGATNTELPSTTIQVAFKGGQMLESPDKAGLAAFTAAMLREGTENYSAEAFEEALDNLGASISVYADAEGFVFSFSSLTRSLAQSLPLLEERLLRSKFEQGDFERIKQNTLKGIANRATQPAQVASDVYRSLLFDKGDIRSFPASGTEQSIANISLSDVEQFYRNNLSASLAHAVAVSDLKAKDMRKRMAFLSKISNKPLRLPEFNKPGLPEKTRIYLVDQPKAAQSEIRIGYVALPYDATGEYYRAGLMNYPLGGMFNSRINLNLREDKGYTYGARSGFSGSFFAGPFTANAGVRATATDSAVEEFMKEIRNYRERGILDEELAFMKRSIGQRDALNYETGIQKAGFLGQIITYGLDKDFVNEQNRILAAMSRQEINELARRYLHPEQFYIVVVGDKSLIYPGLQRLGYEIVELDKKGEVIGK